MDTIDQNQLKNQIYLIRFGRTSALLFKKKGHEMTIFPVLGKLTHICTWEVESFWIAILSRYILPAFASTPQSEGSSSAASLPPSSDPVSVTRFLSPTLKMDVIFA